MNENTSIIAWVNDDLTAVDHLGNDLTSEIPRSARKRAFKNDRVLRKVDTVTGGVQWRQDNPDEWSYLKKYAHTIDESGNSQTEKQYDIREFIEKSPGLRPTHLFMSDLKWKYLIRSVLRGKNIMMTGPSGCGKTIAAQSISSIFPERPYFYFNLGATQDARSTLIGNTHFVPGQGTFTTQALFVKAIQTENAIILLDELSRAHPDAFNILMTVLDENQKYLRIDEDPDTPTIKVAKGVTFISTANIGAEYTATRVLDRALLDRFQIVEMDTLNLTEECNLLKLKYPEIGQEDIQSVAEIAHHTRGTVKSDDPKVSTIISTRQTVQMCGLIYDGFSLAESAEVCVFPFYSDAGGVDSERTYMKQLVQRFMKTTDDKTPWTNTDPAPF